MKVIIQDSLTKQYLAADGRWVADEAAARDFLTLLRAYHFATGNLLGRFHVLLYCPDDDYTSCIIEGEGMARVSAPATQTSVIEKPSQHGRNAMIASRLGCARGLRFDVTRNHLN